MQETFTLTDLKAFYNVSYSLEFVKLVINLKIVYMRKNDNDTIIVKSAAFFDANPIKMDYRYYDESYS